MDAQVWLGCLASYNEGNLIGKWVSLNSFDSKGDFHEFIKTYFAELDDSQPLESGMPREEWQFNDWENIPSVFISQYSIDSQFWELKKHLSEMDDDREKPLLLFLEHHNYDDMDALFEAFESAYCGQYDSMKDYAEEEAELQFGEELLNRLGNYFDYSFYEHDLKQQGFWYEDGYVFRP